MSMHDSLGDSDQLLRFSFAGTDIRGAIIRISTSYTEALQHQIHTPPVRRLLGESLAAAGLLSSTLKMEGLLALQAKSEGSIPLLLAECNSRRELRGIVRGADQAQSDDFAVLLRNGQLAISLLPDNGARYQGIVALEGDNLAQCLEAYFRQSEQLATRLWLAADTEHAAGLLLQRLPGSAGTEDATWQHLEMLAGTLSAEELWGLPPRETLHRLFHQETLHLLAQEPTVARCSCSRERTIEALLALGRQELDSIVAEQGQIQVHCQFCHQEHRFSAADVASLFTTPEGATRH